ncbi:MAG: hypothetical protein RLY82_363, partial [Pseudomonadota bacterium]
NLFGTYVPPELVDEMVKDPANYSMAAANRELTVIFSDMRGFTKMSETMEPIALQSFLNGVFSRLTNLIRDNRGTIDKYMGDCVMAFWGAPEAQNDHAARAVRCGIDMQTAIAAYNTQRSAGGIVVQMGVGIHTGLMCVGDMGSEIRRSYTVVGEAVNLASRLEGLCKTYNQSFIISAATKEAATQNGLIADWQSLGLAQVVGSDDPILIFTLPHKNLAT